jgi:myo-inositol-1(or 4)-monophosphatase
MSPNLERLMQGAQRIVQDAGATILKSYSKVPGNSARIGTTEKSSFKDLVTAVDVVVESEIVAALRSLDPKIGVLGEESISNLKVTKEKIFEQVAGDLTWVLDPIDGTTNFARGYPFFCTNLALMARTQSGTFEPLLGLTHNPVNRELFWAQKGSGAYLGRERLSVSHVSQLAQALLTTGFASERSQSDAKPFALFERLTRQSLGVRRDGSAALDLAYVACGRIDAYWEWGLSLWDVAAGALLVTEAGGQVSGLLGQPVALETGEILATNGEIHRTLSHQLSC